MHTQAANEYERNDRFRPAAAIVSAPAVPNAGNEKTTQRFLL
jgi:hypothetical protein